MNAFGNIFSQPLFMTDSELKNFIVSASEFGNLPKMEYDGRYNTWRKFYEEFYNPVNRLDSIAIVTISGPMMKSLLSYGMDIIASFLEDLFKDETCKVIILKISSGGGAADAMFLLLDTLSRKNKPIIAYVEDYCCSAAYGVASACDEIFVNRTTAYVGSIGVLSSIADIDKFYESFGLKIHNVYAEGSKDKNIEVRELFEGNNSLVKANLDIYLKDFINTISKNRSGKLKSDSNEWGTGKTYFAKEAIELGLIDGIMPLNDIISNIIV